MHDEEPVDEAREAEAEEDHAGAADAAREYEEPQTGDTVPEVTATGDQQGEESWTGEDVAEVVGELFPDDGSGDLRMGAGLGVLAVGEFALIGVACPLCVVGAPILAGTGIVKKIQRWQYGIPTE
ncbi:MAG: hypothetical protein QF415_07520 [Candidatus Undinarchaeales archaeon]|jgi:hypothetical protein|nr:hypothetical protein [Candidatus Undinarchaeales archaeon]MDP7492313.1 hypothetical protein [Candidatus Undinarchaeales archaeon]